MTRLIVRCGTWAVAVLGATVATGAAQPPAFAPGGQPVGPVNRPAVSPYLNLLRNSNSPGVNYYGLVKPQLQTQNSLSALQATQAAQGAQLANSPYEGTDSNLPATGVGFGYMTHTRYFMTNRAGSGGAGRTGGGRPGAGGMGGGGMGGRR